jgi:hypothetical protein
MMLDALVRRSLMRHAGLLAGLAAVLSAFQVLLVLIGRNLQREGLFAQLAAIVPPFIQEVIGGADGSFGGLVAFGFFHPVVIIALTFSGIYLASELAGEVEDGLVDIVVARPVPRRLMVTRSALVTSGATTAVVASMLVANRAAVAWLAPPGVPAPLTSRLMWVALNLLAVVWCFAAASLALAAHARRRAFAAGVIGLAMVCLYLLQFAAAAWAPARPLARISPFHYYEGMRTVLGLNDARPDIIALLFAAALMAGWAYVAYARRDL